MRGVARVRCAQLVPNLLNTLPYGEGIIVFVLANRHVPDLLNLLRRFATWRNPIQHASRIGGSSRR